MADRWSEALQPDFDNMFDLLRRGVWMGCCITQWTREKWDKNGGMDYDVIVPMLIHRNIVSLADSVAILIKNRTSDAIPNLLRVMFESHLALKWICRNDSKQRAYNYLAGQFWNEIVLLKSFLDGTPQNQDIKRALKDDDVYHDAPLLVPPEQIAQRIAHLEEALRKEDFRVALEYFQKKKKNAKWYGVAGGPSSLKKLATELSELGVYESIYRIQSESAHALDATKSAMFKGNHFVVRPIRQVWSIGSEFSLAMTILTGSNRLVCEALNSHDDHLAVVYHYFAHIRPGKLRYDGYQVASPSIVVP